MVFFPWKFENVVIGCSVNVSISSVEKLLLKLYWIGDEHLKSYGIVAHKMQVVKIDKQNLIIFIKFINKRFRYGDIFGFAIYINNNNSYNYALAFRNSMSNDVKHIKMLLIRSSDMLSSAYQFSLDFFFKLKYDFFWFFITKFLWSCSYYANAWWMCCLLFYWLPHN